MTYDPIWNEASPEEDEASGSSLDLAPWVAPRAAERPETTMAKVLKWRRGDCLPRRERSAG